ncbi:uncharacterized protein [Haliotis cracherodii]|uniref:uncharacterized protein n=1 Tax=Haliotis cracherodii TaxID=6455 RepID=UPI0039EA752B
MSLGDAMTWWWETSYTTPRPKEGSELQFCDPVTSPCQVESNPSWKTAIEIHPKHAPEFNHTHLGEMVDLLTSSPNVRALGEVVLDRTTPSYTWGRQEEVLRKVLKFSAPDQIIVLHLRQTKDDLYGSDVHGHGIQMMRAAGSPTQVVHVHSFTWKDANVAAWLSDFPDTYLIVNAMVEGREDQTPSARYIYWASRQRQVATLLLVESPTSSYVEHTS